MKLKILEKDPVYTEKQIKIFQKVKNAYEENGCTLISTIENYVNRNSLMKFICSCGNFGAVKSFINFKRSPVCGDVNYKCFSQKSQNIINERLDEYKNLFEQFGCILLIEDKTLKEEYFYICSCGNKDQKSIKNFTRIPHCDKCTGIVTIESMKKTYTDNGCKLINDINSLRREINYNFICKCGKEDCKTYKSFEKNSRCSNCDDDLFINKLEQNYIQRGAILLIDDKKREEILSVGKKEVDEMTLKFKCHCGNDKCEKRYRSFLKVSYCDKCILNMKKLQYEKYIFPYDELKKIVESYGYTVITTKDEYVDARTGLKAICPNSHHCRVVKQCLLKGSTCCIECGKINRIKTMIERYGCENAMHCPELIEKAMKKMYSYKIYQFPSGIETLFQGYENYCLDELLNSGIKEEEIVSQFARENNNIKVPSISYNYEDKPRKYYPDFYIPYLNLIIEVKSKYTFELHLEKNFAKRIACIEQGFNFQFWFYNHKGEKIKIL